MFPFFLLFFLSFKTISMKLLFRPFGIYFEIKIISKNQSNYRKALGFIRQVILEHKEECSHLLLIISHIYLSIYYHYVSSINLSIHVSIIYLIFILNTCLYVFHYSL